MGIPHYDKTQIQKKNRRISLTSSPPTFEEPLPGLVYIPVLSLLLSFFFSFSSFFLDFFFFFSFFFLSFSLFFFFLPLPSLLHRLLLCCRG